MKITKSRLKQIIKEELDNAGRDTDNDGIPDERELGIVDRGELSVDPFKELINQLFDIRKQHKAKEQWDVARYVDEAIDRLQHAQSLAKTSLSEMRSYGTGWAPQTLLRHPDVEGAFSSVDIRGIHAGHIKDVVDAYDRSNIESPHDQLKDLKRKLSQLTHFERSTSYAAVGAILDQLRREDSFT